MFFDNASYHKSAATKKFLAEYGKDISLMFCHHIRQRLTLWKYSGAESKEELPTDCTKKQTR